VSLEVALIAIAAFVISGVLTAAVRKLALSRQWVDVPNARSSHVTPTPRGGGAAIVVATLLALLALVLRGIVSFDLLLALGGGGIAVALVGFVDDRHQLSATVRLAVHFGAALWALLWLGGLPPLLVGEHLVGFGWASYPVGALLIVWILNLFNFMDGIDAIAASEATFVSWAAALLAILGGVASGATANSIAFGAACAGFLLWNWPPAKIFMGDVGSGYLGYFIAVLAIGAARDNPTAPFVWLTLGGVFFVDATVTFVRRLARGEPVHQAHRSHGYQWLARRLRSHRRVAMLAMTINVLWLLPCAFFAAAWPRYAVWICTGALAPLVVIAIAVGAGRREDVTP
jgi:Fuc2NAc and GlcNAc transferase